MKYIKAGEGTWITGNGYHKNIVLLGDDLHAEGAMVQFVRIEPHTEVAAHYHKKMTEVFHILEGRGIMVISGQTFNLAPGDTLTCEPTEVHSARNDFDQVFRYVVFKTNAEDGDSYWLEA